MVLAQPNLLNRLPTQFFHRYEGTQRVCADTTSSDLKLERPHVHKYSPLFLVHAIVDLDSLCRMRKTEEVAKLICAYQFVDPLVELVAHHNRLSILRRPSASRY
ncbi:hypothetical protein KOR42_05390 [Thalassoglobus neptunius]|uniref:Uncharacterized protein n=1 Tax=Thalassoglobus neptunius TaxID=1938619 RepID=A0A5C5X4C5_9PLAN|nr:hypothetical protein KOR42_05390 [Thalassoglobus neptunius]